MSKSKFTVANMTQCALLAALYVVLATYFSIKVTFIHITFSSLPVVLAAFLMGTGPAVLVAGVGEFIAQVLGYGLGISTFLFMAPQIVRALVLGFLISLLCKGMQAEKKPLLLCGIVLIASVATSLTTTLTLWIDSHLMGYYSYKLVFVLSMQRMVSSLVTATVISLICIPVLTALRRLPAFRTAGKAQV